jgi:hypothetical protein
MTVILTPIENLYDNDTLEVHYDEEHGVTWDTCNLCDTITISVDVTDWPEYWTVLYSTRIALGVDEVDEFMQNETVGHLRENHPEIKVEV